MHRIKKRIDQLKGDVSPKITQDKLNEYGLTGITLRPYQLDGVAFIRKCFDRRHGCILGDEMGLGKTIQVISTLIHLKGSKQIEGPFLVLCPLSVLDNWKSEFKRFAGVFKVVSLVGDKDEREEIKHSIRHSSQGNTGSFNVLLTTYEICIREVSFLCNFHWKVLAVDEAHRLKNSKSLLHQELIKFKRNFTILLTGTPVQNNLTELYSLLSFVSPEIFESDLVEEFLENFADIKETSGKSNDLQYLLSPFLLRRVKSEVMKDLPQKSEGWKLFHATPTWKRLRDHKVLVFSQMTRMLDILQDYLGYRGFTYERLDGSVRGEERYLAVRNFNEMEDTFAFLLSTKAGGQGLNLTSADTVIFVDSDFNPQNDLQAAARAHRLGQTRPVKIIRLVARNTVEEIILKRADEKLKLTNSVLEGGQFSSVSQGLNHIADTNVQLANILKFGLDKLFDSEENPVTDKDFERILGKSSRGEWVVEDDKKQEQGEVGNEASEAEADSMYVYEGRDYSKETSDRDKDAFDKMVTDMLEEVRSSERATRSVAKLQQPHILDFPTRKRKALTTEELEERRKKRNENAAKKTRLREEKEQMKEEARKERLEILWKENNYNSLNVALNDEDEDESEEERSDEDEDEERLDIQYVNGDVTQPIKSTGSPAIIVHCVDDSGYWGKGGLFTVISRRSSSSVQNYELAGTMEDLHLGDAHLIPFSEDNDKQDSQNYLSLIVSQTRDKHHRLLPMNLSALSEGLERVYKAAKQLNATVHLPRIGHTTPGFNWYGTERLIRKHLASRGVSTMIYYYPRKQTAVSKPDISSNENSSDENEESSVQFRPEPEQSRVSCEPSTSTRPLPDFFSGVRVYFKDVSGEKAKKLSRYVIAYPLTVENCVIY
ncbi:hypothetical protein QZH41_020800 [Actinostola sp. cb2023]|nr:hypothetical protein QZH41_020800 [Actinostola sp. cb2023]